MESYPGTATPLVRFRNVEKRYAPGSAAVVQNLNLDIRTGEFLSLLGPSGSGKTTTLMMLAGFEHPTGGDIELDGRSILATPPHRRQFGMVFQNYALFPHMTVARNVAYPLVVRRVPAEEVARRVRGALDRVKLVGLDERLPARLSGGQQQRVALARALVFEPRLVLMDEPLGALDRQLREHMQVELKALHRALGLTFVYVTHDQGEALTLSDRVAVFSGGCIQQVDRVEKLYEEPANAFVAGFVGDSTRFEGVLAPEREPGMDGQARVVLPGGSVLTGTLVGQAAPGAAVCAMIRPEQIRLVPPDAAQDAVARSTVLPATVLDTLYYGDHRLMRCQTAAGQEAQVRLGAGGTCPARGETVGLELPSAHLRLYAQAASAAPGHAALPM